LSDQISHIAQPAILCLNETKIDDIQLVKDGVRNQVAALGYPLDLQYWNCCKPPKKGYAGTAILISPTLGGIKPLSVTYDIPGDANLEHNLEGRVVTAELEHFSLVATYVPNAGVDGLNRLDYRVKKWDRDFQAYLKNLEVTKGKPVILCGDLNVAYEEIDIFGPKGKDKRAGFTKEERDSFGNFLTGQGFVDTFRLCHGKQVKYSYWNLRSGAREKNQGWRLDYFVAS
jgi:exodeoxyribonuclease III